jgi:hypothetical protein
LNFSPGKRFGKLGVELKKDRMRLGAEMSQAVGTGGELIQIMIQI